MASGDFRPAATFAVDAAVYTSELSYKPLYAL
jgi:hypothetical protein